jgi:ribosomal protein S18 acetylase RimI-like enzyme
MTSQGALLRPASRSDRPAIHRLLGETGLFRPGEIDVALEVLDVYLDDPGQDDYLIRSAVLDRMVAGYVCFGINSMTEGTVELYWIAVAPSVQGRGIGSALLSCAEDESRRLGGRMICCETSSRRDYEPSRSFYRRHGYDEAARVPGYYAPGDDKIIFTKSL